MEPMMFHVRFAVRFLLASALTAAAGAQSPRFERRSIMDAGAGAKALAAVGTEGARFLVVSSSEAALRLVDAADVDRARVVWRIEIPGGAPQSVAATPDLGEIYVAVRRTDPVEAFGLVHVYRNGGEAAPTLVRSHVVGVGPKCVRLSPDLLTLVVAVEDGGTPDRAGRIDLLDLGEPDAAEARTSIAIPGFVDPEPEQVAVSPDGRFALVTLQEQSALAVVDLSAKSLKGVVSLAPGEEPHGVAWTPDGRIAVTGNEGGQSLGVFLVGETGLPERVSTIDLRSFGRRFGGVVDPEGVECTVVNGVPFVFACLERAGSVVAFDLGDPHAPRFVDVADAGSAPYARPEALICLKDGVTLAVADEGEGTVALFRLAGASVRSPPTSSASNEGVAFIRASDRPPVASALAAPKRAVVEKRDRAANGARLVVVVVVDQLASDVYSGARPFFGPDGFRRLEREGAYFPEAAHDHACTETAPGHATLGTGAPPSVHGIMSNEWPDPTTGIPINSVLADGVPAIGAPAGVKARGADLRNLRAPTFGDALREAFGPRSKIVGLSMKPRSSLFMVGRSADVAAWLDYEAGYWVSSPDHGPAPPPFLAKLNDAGPARRLLGGRWDRFGPEEAYRSLGDDASPFERGLDGRSEFPHELRTVDAGGKGWSEAALTTSHGNAAVLEATRAAIRTYELGADDAPDYLFVGFSANDLVGHAYGPTSHETRSITLETDAQLAELFRLLDAEVGRGRWNLALTADHGVAPVPEEAVRRGIPAGRVDPLKVRGAAESALVRALGDPGEDRWTKAHRTYHLVLDRARLEARGVPLDAAAEIAARGVRDVPGIARAWSTRALLARGPADDVEARVVRTLSPDRMADVYVLPAPFHMFSRNPSTHGTPYDYDRRVAFLLYGPGVRSGFESWAPIAPGSIVATLSELIGIPPPSAASYPALLDALVR